MRFCGLLAAGAFLLATAAAPAVRAELLVTGLSPSRFPEQALVPGAPSDGLPGGKHAVVPPFRADLVLNACLLIRGVELAPSPDPAQPPSFRLPLSGWKDRKYADIRVLSKSLYDHMLEALRAARASGLNARAARGTDFVVGTIERLGSASRTANAEVIFGGELSVVLGVGRGRRVAYPSHRLEGGAVARDFEILDAALKAKVEAAVLKKLKAAP